MNCKHCGDPDSKVIETREWRGGLTRRKRECLGCGRKFDTFEVPGSLIRRHEVDRYLRGVAKRAKALDLSIRIAVAPAAWSAPKVARSLGVSATTVLNYRRERREGKP